MYLSFFQDDNLSLFLYNITCLGKGVMRFSFIHTSDIHLGRAFSDLSVLNDKFALCNQACKVSFDRIVELAISKQVDFVLIAGDNFDNDEHDLSAKISFIKNLIKLADNNIKSYVICGNHDPISLYDNIKNYFTGDIKTKYENLINITGVTSEEFVKSYSPMEGVEIHSLSFKTEECTNPAKLLDKSKKESNYNIGLIHCDLDKIDSKYAPVSREDLRKLDYDYYALGHIHIPSVSEDKFVYSGTPQARTKKETGEHGCFYVQVDGKNTDIQFVPIDSVRFNSLDIDCSVFINKMEVFDNIVETINNSNENVDLSLFEINLTGVSKAFDDLNSSDNLLEEYLENYASSENNNVSVYEINNNTIPFIDESEFISDTGVIGIIAKAFGENSDIDVEEIYNNMSEIHENIYKKLKLDKESNEFLSESLKVDKDLILSNVKKEIKSLCAEICSLE